MIGLLVLFAATALVAPVFTRRLGTKVFLVAAIPATAAFVHALVVLPRVIGGGEVVERVEYIPSLGLDLDFRMDALGVVVSLVVAGIGALVLLYCVRYFRDDEPSLGRFAGVLTAFAGAMYGLVVADNVYLVFVFWEATSVLSYLLIGHYTSKRASRGAALQALLVTTLGGLAMLVGLVMLVGATGTARLSGMLADPPVLDDPFVVVAVLLVLAGAISKSALVPFHFWLPNAMSAPTPVSAYLHAAAMVKAGVYLVARLAPAFAATPGWREVLLVLGVTTMLVGGVRALREHDLKLVLAGGTVAQLGFLMTVASFGTAISGLAAIALLLAHALFKSTLFLVVGIVDHHAGTRDLRKLSGFGRRAPVVAAAGILAAASMAGIPPTFGFVAKETVLAAFMHAEGGLTGWGLFALVGVTAGSVLTVAYSVRFVWGAFWSKPGLPTVEAHRHGLLLQLSPVLLASAGLVLGPLAPLVEAAPQRYSATLPGDGYSLELWHGFNIELALSVVTIVGGAVLFVLRERVAPVLAALIPRRDADTLYRDVLRAVDRGSTGATTLTQRGSLPFYLTVILLVFLGATTAVLAIGGEVRSPELLFSPAQAIVAVVISVAAIAAALAGKRFQAVVLAGVTGFGMAVLFALQGAPDLALTQVLVDLVTLIAFVLVLRRLPARLGVAHGSTHPVGRALLGVAVGVVMCVVAVTALAARTAEPISLAFPDLAVDGGNGLNIVNVMLVDIRGWDTMGELSVLIAAATGVASLVFVSSRSDRMPALGGQRSRRPILGRRPAQDPSSPGRGTWLLAGPTLQPRNRSILLEVVVRLVFHAVILISLYLLIAGHNAPGGGFAGGLVAGLALTGRYLAAGRYELAAAAPLNAGLLLGVGMLLAAGSALAPLLVGASALESFYFPIDLGWFGQISFVTSTIFDIGVYLVVIGLILDVLRSLGAEIDRQYEEELTA